MHVGLLHRLSCEDSRKLELPLSRQLAASRRPRWGPFAHRRQTVPAPLGCGAEPRRQCAPACGSRGHNARWPPTSPIRLARRSRDNASCLLRPSLPEAHLHVAFDAAQQTWPDVFTSMNRYGRHTLAALDAHVRAALAPLDATERPRMRRGSFAVTRARYLIAACVSRAVDSCSAGGLPQLSYRRGIRSSEAAGERRRSERGGSEGDSNDAHRHALDFQSLSHSVPEVRETSSRDRAIFRANSRTATV